MSNAPVTPLLDQIQSPADLRGKSLGDLRRIADELRAETIWQVSQTGGHLGAGLGVVELTVALHAVFQTPRDKLIWDVSHQCYPHKILTGRRAQMGSLRQKDGLSGFAKRSESPFDPFGAGHSSTSISAALGFAVAAEIGGASGDAIAVIGDGAMTGGMAFEALNHAGHLGQRLIVILNDNGLSIAPPVGALAKALLHGQAQPPNSPLPPLFQSLGFDYRGPVDGHDMGQLVPLLESVRASRNGPVLIHVLTRKGKGYLPAERAADGGHATDKFDLTTGEQAKPAPNAPSYTSVFSRALIAEAKRDERIVAVTAAMPDGTGTKAFMERFASRAFDVGIAEQHAVTFCAGMAAAGLRPFCAIYSTFLQRGYDQIVHDVAVQGLPVRFAIDRAGLVGADGPTHAGAFDIAFLANLPGFVVMAAADEAELARMVATAARHDAGPIAFRFPRGEGVGVELPAAPEPLEIGKGRMIRQGSRAAILSFGARLAEAERACEALAAEGISPSLADARFAKPLDRDLILRLAAEHEALVTIEEGAVGGFGSHVAQLLCEEGALDGGLKFRAMTLPDCFLDQASPAQMYAAAALDAEAIAAKIRALLA